MRISVPVSLQQGEEKLDGIVDGFERAEGGYVLHVFIPQTE